MDWVSTIIGIAVIALILFFAIRYMYKKKKKGVQCIGCPYAESCTSHKPKSDNCAAQAASTGSCCCH